MPFIEPFQVERWFSEYEFSVSLNIAESCIKPLTLREICEIGGLDLEELLSIPVGYVDAAGSLDLRRAVAGLYPDTAESQVLVTTGAIEANYILHSAMVHPGDTVICQWPAYQQLYEVARSRGANVLFWKLRRENAFHPDVSELRSLASDGARLIVINNPHNPTGALLSTSEMREVCEIARQAGALLHVDEVYNGIFYGEEEPSARAIDPDAVVTGSMSKAYGLSGVRTGWIAGPREIVDACSVVRDYTSICPAMLSERLALTVLLRRDDFLRRSMAIARHNLGLVEKWMETMAPVVSWVRPVAGVVGFPWYEAGLRSDALCSRLAREYDTLLLPGVCFGHDSHFRLGFGYDTVKLEKGLEQVSRLFADLRA